MKKPFLVDTTTVSGRINMGPIVTVDSANSWIQFSQQKEMRLIKYSGHDRIVEEFGLNLTLGNDK